MEWFRWYHGSVSDPKFRLLAKLADVKLTEVLAVWQTMLEHASQCSRRGSLEGWRDDVAAVALDIESNAVERIRTQANHVGLLANAGDGIEFLASWDKRQPKREDGSAERAKAWREQKKLDANADEQKRTQKNIEQNRTEQNREEEKEYSLHPEAVQLAVRLIDRIHKTNPKAKTGNPQTWAKHTDRMLRLDGRTVEEVEAVIDWCQRDSFWCSNILSTKKLREKFDQLTAQMNRKLKVVNDRPDKFAGAI